MPVMCCEEQVSKSSIGDEARGRLSDRSFADVTRAWAWTRSERLGEGAAANEVGCCNWSCSICSLTERTAASHSSISSQTVTSCCCGSRSVSVASNRGGTLASISAT